jgi:hypothetical protein
MYMGRDRAGGKGNPGSQNRDYPIRPRYMKGRPSDPRWFQCSTWNTPSGKQAGTETD